MKLHQMYKNVLDMEFDSLMLKIEQESIKRIALISQSMSKNDYAPRTSAKLTDQEKAILKALGLSMKDIKALKGGLNE